MTADASTGLEDSRLQKLLRAYGTAIARRPLIWGFTTFLVCLAIALPGWLSRKTFGGSKDFMSPVDMDLQWSVEGGETEQNLLMWKERRGDGDDNDWAMKYHTTQFVGKARGEDSDVLTRDALLEWIELDAKYTTLEVQVGNNTYTTWDLCSRGILPDIPGVPTMPCLTVSPLHCFREMGDVNHETYKALDPFIDQIIPGTVPYSTRPALVNLTDAEIKSIVSALPNPSLVGPPGEIRGCIGQYSTALFTADIWGGLLEWQDGTTITKAGALRGMYYLDGPARVAYRMSEMKPTHANLEDIKEAQRKHSALWQSVCEEQNRKNTYLEVANMEDWSYIQKALDEEHSTMNWGYLAAGASLMVAFCAFILVSWRHPMASRANVGFQGLLVVNISQITAFGLFFLVGKYLNAPMMLAMPLLSLGLGVDDMFVLLRYFSDLGVEYIDSHSNSEILGEVLAQAGPGVLLTSVCNSLAFACGFFLPIPAMSDFCLLAAIVAVINYICLTNMFLPLLILEAHRVKQRSVDPHMFTCLCQRMFMKRDIQAEESSPEGRRASKDATSTEGYSWHPEKQMLRWLRCFYAPVLVKPAVSVAIGLFGLACLIACSILIHTKSIGYSPSELFAQSDPNYRSVDLLFKKFALFQSWLVFHDLDIAAHQVEMLQLYKDIGSTEFGMYGVLPPYLTMLYLNVYMGAAAAAPPNVTDPVAIAASAGFDMSWTDPALAPFGILSQDSDTFYGTFNSWRKFPDDPLMAWMPANQGLIYADMCYLNEVQAVGYPQGTSTGSERLSFSYFPFSRVGLTTEDKFVKAIRETKEVVEASPIKDNAFVYGPISTYWEVFLELDIYVWIVFAADAVIIFLATLLVFSFDVVTAAITSMACSMIVLEIYGLACAFMSFNVFVAAISLMGMGLSVEFTAHLAAAFSLASGPRAERLGNAMAHTFPALVEGSLSTFFSILPMAFHPTLFTVKYLFGIIAMVVGVGLINGLLIMPGLIGLASPCFALLERKPAETTKLNSQSGPGNAEGQPTLLVGQPAESTNSNKQKDAAVCI